MIILFSKEVLCKQLSAWTRHSLFNILLSEKLYRLLGMLAGVQSKCSLSTVFQSVEDSRCCLLVPGRWHQCHNAPSHQMPHLPSIVGTDLTNPRQMFSLPKPRLWVVFTCVWRTVNITVYTFYNLEVGNSSHSLSLPLFRIFDAHPQLRKL